MVVNRIAVVAVCALFLFGLCLILTGSGVLNAPPPQAEAEISVPVPSRQPPIAVLAVAAASTKAVDGDGKLVYGDTPDGFSASSGQIVIDKLDGEQEKLLLDYMHYYYESLAGLEPKSASGLFAGDAKEQADSDRQILTALCGIRKAQDTDLALDGYSFVLTVQTITEENGEIRVRLSEDSTQNFAEHPEVDSKSFGIIHTFVMMKTNDGWRLREHRQAGSLNRLVRGLGPWRPGASQPAAVDAATDTGSRVSLLLKNAGNAVKLRKNQGSDASLSADYNYDRDAAVAYARRFAGTRSDEWPSYDRYGGNCQNFTSQALLAGGIPMDYVSPGQWKWFGETPNGGFSASGRSPSWSGVDEFLGYVENNSGYGLVAQADAAYYSGEAGDIIHLGANGDWRHTVMVTGVVKDEGGGVKDYLIASNTANLLDFPVSAYYYTQQMLIKIHGWND